MKTFKDKQVLITGGSSGIGLALAKKLARAGAHVWLLARRQALLESALEALEQERVDPQQRFGTTAADITNAAEITSKVQSLITAHGVPDLLINSAGIVHPALFQDTPLDSFECQMQVNYLGTVYATYAVIHGMIARGSGYIVNVSSMAGYLGTYGYTAYGASKYAVRGFSDALRAEMKPLGIGVTIVFPPDTDTPQLAHDQKYKPAVTKELAGVAKVLSAEQVADAVIKGIKARRYIITPGSDNTFYYYLSSLTGNLVYTIMDMLISSAIRKHGHSHHQGRKQDGAHPDQV